MQITYRNEATVSLAPSDVVEAVRQFVKAAHPEYAVEDIKFPNGDPSGVTVDVKRISPGTVVNPEFDHRRYETPLKCNRHPKGRPLSHWTILGYLAVKKPDLLRAWGDAADATIREGFKLAAICKRRGVTPEKCAAPPVLREQGIDVVNAYPLMVLREHFGF